MRTPLPEDILFDPASGLLRLSGPPETLFRERPLLMLQMLRAASELDLSPAPEEDRVLRLRVSLLSSVPPEDLFAGLTGLLCGPGAGRVMRSYPEVMTFLVPALGPCVGYDQQNPHHRYTVWEHTVRAVENVPPDPVLRLTMLLHDTGKPGARTTDENGIGHYKGHQKLSAELARETLAGFRCDPALSDRIVRLVEAHDIALSTDPELLRRRLERFGEEDLRALFLIHRADRIATGTRNPEHAAAHCEHLNAALDALLRE